MAIITCILSVMASQLISLVYVLTPHSGFPKISDFVWLCVLFTALLALFSGYLHLSVEITYFGMNKIVKAKRMVIFFFLSHIALLLIGQD